MKLHEKTTKSNAMLHVTLACTLVIAIVIFLFAKGYVADKLTLNFVRYMSQRKILLLYLGVINLVTFILFGIDKYAAIKGKWRISVATLLGFSFAGGAIGGIIAMYIFHHKTQKNYFAVGLPMMIVTQLVVLFYCMNAPW